MPNQPLNPDALEAAARATYEMRNPESWARSWDELDLDEREEEWVKPARTVTTAYLTVAQPEVNSLLAEAWAEGHAAGEGSVKAKDNPYKENQ